MGRSATDSGDRVSDPTQEVPAEMDRAPAKRRTWAQTEGIPLPLGVTWIEEEEAYNFAVHSEHAESVILLLYSATDLVKPLRTFPLDFLRNKSGRIWHCRIPLTDMGEARYYAYSVSGQTIPQLHCFDPQKVLLDPYANASSSRRVLRAKWQRGKDQTRAKRRWECSLATAPLLTGEKTVHRTTSLMRSSASFT
jgi:pullulanase/glycogen debranching enzyme